MRCTTLLLGMHLLLVAVAATAAGASAAPSASGDLLIEHVTVISPEIKQPLNDRNVLITQGRIAKIGNESLTAPASMPHLNGRGKYLTPGLMDGHVHVSTPAGLPWEVMYLPPDKETPLTTLRDAYLRQQPRSYLYFGVTQLLDPSNDPRSIAVFEAQPLRPDLFRCGATMPLDGYPSLFADKPARYQIFPDYIYEPANQKEHPLPAGVDPAAHTPEAVVEQIAKSGALCVKVFIEDGFGDRNDWPLLSTESLKRLRAAADKHHLLLVAHANAVDMQQIAINVPVDVLMHGAWAWGRGSDDKPGVPEAVQAHLRNVHAKHIGYEPTLRVMAGMIAVFQPETLADPIYAKVVPPALLDWYRSDDGQWYKRLLKKQYDDLPDTRIIELQGRDEDQGKRAMVFLHQIGHPLLLGSDTPSAPTYGNQPGYDTYREMQGMAKAGIEPRAIFEAATLNNARQFRLEKDYGTVESGKIANLVLLEADPLASVDAWNHIDKVILHGKVIDRESLTASH